MSDCPVCGQEMIQNQYRDLFFCSNCGHEENYEVISDQFDVQNEFYKIIKEINKKFNNS
ncbi:MAG: hypothetical protein GF387_02965 [Candidatus Portnoybacteria bacterium]|nr:hypothetical protein [Candidatus Portnoybacteria bacterium]